MKHLSRAFIAALVATNLQINTASGHSGAERPFATKESAETACKSHAERFHGDKELYKVSGDNLYHEPISKENFGKWYCMDPRNSKKEEPSPSAEAAPQ